MNKCKDCNRVEWYHSKGNMHNHCKEFVPLNHSSHRIGKYNQIAGNGVPEDKDPDGSGFRKGLDDSGSDIPRDKFDNFIRLLKEELPETLIAVIKTIYSQRESGIYIPLNVIGNIRFPILNKIDKLAGEING